jgi:hypothetical protein
MAEYSHKEHWYNKIMKEQYIWIDEYGNKCYYKDRKMTILHRLDGPAVEWSNGDKVWWVNGKKHRLDGPAVEGEGVDGIKSWYVDGEYLNERRFNALSAPKIELTLDEIAAKFGVDASKLKIKK